MLARIFRRLFDNEGAGPKLRPDIIPLADPDFPGGVPAGGAANQVYRVNADGDRYEWGSPDGYALLDIKPNIKGVVDDGFLSICVDNGELLSAAFPEASNLIKTLKASGGNVVSMEEYVAEQAAQNGVCIRFALSEDGTKFRIPCAPGLFWRGLSATNGLDVGMWRQDQMQGHWHESLSTLRHYSIIAGVGSGWALETEPVTPTGYISAGNAVSDRANGVPRVGPETAPVHAVCDYQMKMYGVMSDAGTVSLGQMIASMAGKLDTSRYEADAPLRVKAWAFINASGEIQSAHNIASVSRASAGNFLVTFNNVPTHINYVVVATVKRTGSVSPNIYESVSSRKTESFTISIENISIGGGIDTPFSVAVIW